MGQSQRLLTAQVIVLRADGADRAPTLLPNMTEVPDLQRIRCETHRLQS